MQILCKYSKIVIFFLKVLCKIYLLKITIQVIKIIVFDKFILIEIWFLSIIYLLRFYINFIIPSFVSMSTSFILIKIVFIIIYITIQYYSFAPLILLHLYFWSIFTFYEFIASHYIYFFLFQVTITFSFSYLYLCFIVL